MKFISCRAEPGKDVVRNSKRSINQSNATKTNNADFTASSLTVSSSLFVTVCALCALQLYSLEECVLGAYAADGGMFLPAELPVLSASMLRGWASLSFAELVLEFMGLFVLEEEVSRPELRDMIDRAFAKFTRRNSKGDKQVREEIGVQPLQSAAALARDVTVAELWHGQTLAFKDLPLQFLGQLLSHFVARRGQRVNILVGTSGDTGSAAIEAVRHSPLVNIFVLYPSGGRITAVQELQMTTAMASSTGSGKLNNVIVGAVDGTSDDLDEPILRLFDREPTFAQRHHLCSINSVNVIRILMQCVHFIYMYLRMRPEADGEVVDFVLPTGAAGHIAAGVLVKSMGLPIGRLVAATNSNDLLAHLLTDGRFFPRASGALQTSSPAIDIQVPYNVERILYLMAQGDHLQKTAEVRKYMSALAPLSAQELAANSNRVRGFTLPPSDLARWRQFGLAGHSVSHAEVISTIRSTWHSGSARGSEGQQGYMLDPHTAVAVTAARLLPRAQTIPNTHSRAIVFATAHPAKFIPTVMEATGMDEKSLRALFSSSPYDNVARAMTLHTLPSLSIPFAKGEDWEAKLRQLIVQVNAKQDQQQLKSKL